MPKMEEERGRKCPKSIHITPLEDGDNEDFEGSKHNLYV